MGRTISAGVLVRDQVDIYNPVGSFTRQSGIVPAGLQATLFVNDALVNWPVQNGTNVPDSSVSAGSIYFNEIAGSPGFYNLRFFPDRTGFWRLIIKVTMTSVEIIKEYDVVPPSGNTSGGLNATFVK